MSEATLPGDVPGVADGVLGSGTVVSRTSLTALPLGTTAALVGEYRWIETALYETLGAWVRDLPVAAVQVHLDGQSMRHAWHAELWGDRLPVLSGVDPDQLTQPSAASVRALRRARRGRRAGRRSRLDLVGDRRAG